jgi:amidase
MTSTPTTALWRLGATELAALIRAGEVSSREVVDAHLDRIEAVNPAVNAIRVTLADRARADADAADRQRADGASLGPLHGVPFTVKENIDVAGTATTWGLATMTEALAARDAPVVENLRAIGAIPIARTNMPDLALRWHTDSGVAGATINPWDPRLTPGGSSAGESVALATGMTPLGLGNDLGGSLRWPSQCAGTMALRPSHGRVPDANDVPPTDGPPSLQFFNTQGPMARSVADLRTAFAALIAPSARDPWHTPAPGEGPALATRPTVAVAVPDDTAPDVKDGVARAADALAAAGYDLETTMPPDVDQALSLWAELINQDVRQLQPSVEPTASEGARRFLAHVLLTTEPLDIAGYAARWQARQALARRWSVQQEQTPLILAPVCLRQPFAPDADLQSLEEVRRILESMRMVVAVNLLGLPSAAVPTGLDRAGVPLGVQIIGPRFREDLCLDAAEAIERVHGSMVPIDPRS